MYRLFTSLVLPVYFIDRFPVKFFSVVAGVNSQIDPVLVLSGVTKIEDLRSFPYRPYLVLKGVFEIPDDSKENIVTEAELQEASRRLSII